MFHFMHGRARSEKGRPNCTPLAVEELERRDVPAAHIGPPALAFPPANAAVAAVSQPPAGASSNGASAASQIPGFYDDNQVTINIKEQSETANASLIDHNKSINTIYAYADLDDEQPFAPVIDAIHGEGFNPLWQQVLIQFNQGFEPHQFTSEEEVLAAEQAGEITLVTTDEVYICAVVRGTGHNA
jgi:hypothetical protein